tara:strand:- start:921 stop:1145 length:225 start_codon:yes stop_codon:yes gene_type:complete
MGHYPLEKMVLSSANAANGGIVKRDSYDVEEERKDGGDRSSLLPLAITPIQLLQEKRVASLQITHFGNIDSLSM